MWEHSVWFLSSLQQLVYHYTARGVSVFMTDSEYLCVANEGQHVKKESQHEPET